MGKQICAIAESIEANTS